MSENTTTTESTESTEAATTTTETVDWQAKFEKEREHSRTWESRAKENKDAAKRLAELEQQHMSDQEKAVAAAKAEGRTEALKEIGARLVDAEVKAAAAGRDIDVAVLLEGLDRSRFLDDDGQPDAKAITAWVDKLAPKGEGFVDIGQGQRTSAKPASDPLVTMLTDAVGGPRT